MGKLFRNLAHRNISKAATIMALIVGAIHPGNAAVYHNRIKPSEMCVLQPTLQETHEIKKTYDLGSYDNGKIKKPIEINNMQINALNTPSLANTIVDESPKTTLKKHNSKEEFAKLGLRGKGTIKHPIRIGDDLPIEEFKKVQDQLPNGTAIAVKSKNGKNKHLIFKQNNYILLAPEYKKFLQAPDGAKLLIHNEILFKKDGLLLDEDIYKDLYRGRNGSSATKGSESYYKLGGHIFLENDYNLLKRSPDDTVIKVNGVCYLKKGNIVYTEEECNCRRINIRELIRKKAIAAGEDNVVSVGGGRYVLMKNDRIITEEAYKRIKLYEDIDAIFNLWVSRVNNVVSGAVNIFKKILFLH